eukprot:Skav205218  [mRNA]  locus=scaffold400:180414:191183:- [translate_table: standard]
MCSDGLDSWFAAMPLFGEVSEKHWDRLELDYDMEACPRNLMMVPPVCTATLYRASVIPVDYLKRRVREIVAANPWLSGRLRKSFDRRSASNAVECGPSFSIHPETSFYDVVKHVQGTEAVLKNGLAALNRREDPQKVHGLSHLGDGFTFYKLCGMLDPSALILKFALQPGPDLQRAVQEARSGVGRFEVPGQPMYILRPGASEDQGWLWIMGLAPDVLSRNLSHLSPRRRLPDEANSQELIRNLGANLHQLLEQMLSTPS